MSKLLKNSNIGNCNLKNKIIMAPMCMYKSDDNGLVKDFHIHHYVTRAIGEVALIIVEATAIEPKGRISSNDLGLWEDAQIDSHKQLVDKCHNFGSKIGIQIAHAGRKSIVESSTPIAPSAISFSEEKPYKMPQELSLEEIDKIKTLFLNSAIRAQKAGYDLVELHGAHGYLLCEFLSPLSNTRDDIYGGSLENRTRLILEIAKLLKENLNIPLLVRLSASEWCSGGWDENDTIYLSKKLEEIGVDAIHISSGGNQLNCDQMPKIGPLYQCDYAKKIKENVSIAVIAVGIITKTLECEKLLNEDYCDFIALGRELLRNPNFVIQSMKELNETSLVDNPSYLRAFF